MNQRNLIVASMWNVLVEMEGRFPSRGLRPKQMKLFLLSLLFVSCFAGSHIKDAGMTHTSVKRVIDLTTHIARHTISITVLNSGPNDAHIYQIAIPRNQSDRLAAIHVFDNSGNELKITQENKNDEMYVIIWHLQRSVHT